MDKNSISTAFCFIPESDASFEVRCAAINNEKRLLATGTEQGVIILWEISSSDRKYSNCTRSLSRFKEIYEKANNLKLTQKFLLIFNNNSVAFPVIQVEFAAGSSLSFAPKDGSHSPNCFNGTQPAEEILLSLHEDSTVCVWSLTNYRCLHKVRGPPFTINKILVLPDRRFIALVGDYKINIIDAWNIKLIETLDISKEHKSAQLKVTADNRSSVLTTESDDPSLEGFSSTGPNKVPKIVSVKCGCAPSILSFRHGIPFQNEDEASLKDIGKTNSCPLLIAILLDNHDMLVLDLTVRISHYKILDGSSNGSIRIISEWDMCYGHKAKITPERKGTLKRSGTSRGRFGINAAREHIFELEKEEGHLCMIDRFIFLLIGYRILVWYYEFDGELIRTAEILSFSDSEFSPRTESWFGLKCLRVYNDANLLLAWLKNGKARMFMIPKRNAKRHFYPVKTIRFPPFSQSIKCNHDICFLIDENLCNYDLMDLGDFPLTVFALYTNNGQITYGKNDFKLWSRMKNTLRIGSTLAHKDRVCSVSIVERNGVINKIELLSNGMLRCINLTDYRIEYMTSPNAVVSFLSSINQDRVFNQFFASYRISTPVKKFENDFEADTSRWILHSVGNNFLVIAMDNGGITIYALSTLEIYLFLNKCHTFPIRSVHNVYSIVSIGEKSKESDLVELPDSFASLDSSGSLVLFNISQFVGHCFNYQNIPFQIPDDSIYSEANSKDNHCTEYLHQQNLIFHSESSRGLHRMDSTRFLFNVDIDKIFVNNERDLLFVLTKAHVLLWRITTGSFLRRFPQLFLYRRAIFLSTSKTMSPFGQLKSSMSFADTITSLLSNKWQTETSDDTKGGNVDIMKSLPPNYLLSLSLFSDKRKRKSLISPLCISFLNLHFKGSKKFTFLSKAKCSRANHRRFLIDSGRAFSKVSKRYVKAREVDFSDLRDEKITKATPFVIFPLTNVLYENHINADILALLESSTLGYLGIPNGSISIPLKFEYFGTCILRHINHRKCILSDEPPKPRVVRCNSFPSVIKDSANDIFDSPHTNTNSYLSTCLLLQDLYFSHTYSSKDVYETVYTWEQSVDIWLLANLMLVCTCQTLFTRLSNLLAKRLNSCSNHELDLHVSRALFYIHNAHSFKMNVKSRTNIYICHCNATTFTFGTRCGACLKPENGLETLDDFATPPKQWEEDASLIILTFIALDNHLYSLRNHVRIGIKNYLFATYVAQQLIGLIMPTQSDPSIQILDKNATLFDSNTFFLDAFTQGFGIIWSLSSLSKQSILPEHIRYSKVATAFRDDFESVEGMPMDNAYFILMIIHNYHLTASDHWNKLLILCCCEDTMLVIDIFGWIVKKKKLGGAYITTSIKLIINFISNFRQIGIYHLPDLVGIIIKCLDPSDYNMRILMLRHATSALFYLVKNIPMVDFHQDTQRFAVGSQTGHIIIYDVRTATKWRMFMGRQSEIGCVAFSSAGNFIAAYYVRVPCFIVWKCSSSGLLGSLLTNTSKEYKVVKLKEISNASISFNEVIYILS
ncbi:hypothetical protein BEWA_006010 [Theileria equi strain WA]|uniref:Uncharacterized protein n=1 Tax=Theileria equi strain WA TaxID=1537102 RepID=L0B008_THEEQ|nr:hypothetical protein BEWA_006010 [Theileria equi strain WA]AFZ81192.1 hypothetical protein BEWA_006010 [Theileria equi strain WA]|eukprot:XP_004830858.1 hypothetical protein BEWA_006010 [Theileria equi strain WA]